MAQLQSRGSNLASLYVGDLNSKVNEGDLCDKMVEAGPIPYSIRVCRDKRTGRSLGYAYVNYQKLAHAEKAMNTMNLALLMGQPMRIMWSQRDPSLRRSGVGNVFIKNFGESLGDEKLKKVFSKFDKTISYKVVKDRMLSGARQVRRVNQRW